nr:putative mitochondrial protein [Tanacetum cinerariifolium]
LLQPLSLPLRVWEDLTMYFIDGLLNRWGDDPEAEYDLPLANGRLSEVVNRSLETHLRCFMLSRPNEWVKWLSWDEYWYNISYHSAIRTTPFKVLYDRDPPSLITYDRGTALTFEKLASRFFGPYEVVERIGKVAYRLKLPPTLGVRNSQSERVTRGDDLVEGTTKRRGYLGRYLSRFNNNFPASTLRTRCCDNGFSDKSHVEYYNGGTMEIKVKEEKKELKKKMKLLKGLSKNLGI